MEKFPSALFDTDKKKKFHRLLLFLGQTLSLQKQEIYIKFYKNGSNSSGDPQVMYEKYDICQTEA